MRINRIAIKNNAKTRIFSTRPNAVAVGALYVLIAYILELLITRLDGSYQMLNDMTAQYQNGNLDYLPPLPAITPVAGLLLIALFLMLLVLEAGFTMYCMKICQDKKAGFRELFDGFTIFLKLIWLEILMGVFIFLWSLLFIIPGIVAAYRYRMALYILIDNPKLSALECIRRSKLMMNGRKGELFGIDLSFLGWRLLTAFPFASVWVTPYTSVTYAYYYLALRDMPEREGRQE